MNSIGAICNRDVVYTTSSTTVAGAAGMMRQSHVGCLIVVEKMDGGQRLPVGIVSIDDLLEVLAEELSELAKIVSREQAREAATRR